MTEYTIQIGLDGEHYAVFKDGIAREMYEEANPEHFKGCYYACFGQYENAFQLNSDWWHRSGHTKAGNNIC